MSPKLAIPPEVRAEVERKIAEFNRKHLRGRAAYTARFRGRYVYVGREVAYDSPAPIFRLTYNGAMDNWDFAIYKYTSERYDPDEWFFPGAGKVDGTVEGALQAGLMAYPI
ncbi:hypothetical protein D6779_00375 [Candidatus Parcubacteria bacterium]|nr:MAG: hypothetical protein D6779_00375 [Candidatus Parcubacteria bacterium]